MKLTNEDKMKLLERQAEETKPKVTVKNILENAGIKVVRRPGIRYS